MPGLMKQGRGGEIIPSQSGENHWSHSAFHLMTSLPYAPFAPANIQRTPFFIQTHSPSRTGKVEYYRWVFIYKKRGLGKQEAEGTPLFRIDCLVSYSCRLGVSPDTVSNGYSHLMLLGTKFAKSHVKSAFQLFELSPWYRKFSFLFLFLFRPGSAQDLLLILHSGNTPGSGTSGYMRNWIQIRRLQGKNLLY